MTIGCATNARPSTHTIATKTNHGDATLNGITRCIAKNAAA